MKDNDQSNTSSSHNSQDDTVEQSERFADEIAMQAETSHSSQTKSTHDKDTQIDALLSQIDEWKNRSMRLAADMQNQSKQHELDMAQSRKTGKRQVAQTLLSFLNTLHLSFAYAPQSNDQAVVTFVTTLQTSFDQLKHDLKSNQIDILTPEVGTSIDPEWMNALNSGSEGVIKQVVSLGLKVDGQLVQAASVVLDDSHQEQLEEVEPEEDLDSEDLED